MLGILLCGYDRRSVANVLLASRVLRNSFSLNLPFARCLPTSTNYPKRKASFRGQASRHTSPLLLADHSTSLHNLALLLHQALQRTQDLPVRPGAILSTAAKPSTAEHGSTVLLLVKLTTIRREASFYSPCTRATRRPSPQESALWQPTMPFFAVKYGCNESLLAWSRKQLSRAHCGFEFHLSIQYSIRSPLQSLYRAYHILLALFYDRLDQRWLHVHWFGLTKPPVNTIDPDGITDCLLTALVTQLWHKANPHLRSVLLVSPSMAGSFVPSVCNSVGSKAQSRAVLNVSAFDCSGELSLNIVVVWLLSDTYKLLAPAALTLSSFLSIILAHTRFFPCLPSIWHSAALLRFWRFPRRLLPVSIPQISCLFALQVANLRIPQRPALGAQDITTHPPQQHVLLVMFRQVPVALRSLLPRSSVAI